MIQVLVECYICNPVPWFILFVNLTKSIINEKKSHWTYLGGIFLICLYEIERPMVKMGGTIQWQPDKRMCKEKVLSIDAYLPSYCLWIILPSSSILFVSGWYTHLLCCCCPQQNSASSALQCGLEISGSPGIPQTLWAEWLWGSQASSVKAAISRLLRLYYISQFNKLTSSSGESSLIHPVTLQSAQKK